MLHASTQKLIQKLCDITSRSEVHWREGEGGASLFDTEGYRIEVKPEPPALRILQADGREIEALGEAELAAAPWPGEQATYADKVRIMGRDAARIARGAEKAISSIMSALSNPPPEEPTRFSTAGGAESEAAMAEAVARMATNLAQIQPEIIPISAAPPLRAVPLAAKTPAASGPARNVNTAAMFGAISSFSTATPPEPRKPAAPAQAKVTSSGLLLTGLHATTVQKAEPVRTHAPAPRPSAAGYRPWT